MKRFAMMAIGGSLAAMLAVAPGAASADDGVRVGSNEIAGSAVSVQAAPVSGKVVRSGGAVHQAPDNTVYGVQVPVGTYLVVHCWRYGRKLENSNVWAFVQANNGVSITGYMHTNWIQWNGAATYCGD